MGQQQLLLLVLGIVIVGLAVVVGIQSFSENQVKANADAQVNDAIRIASDAQAWNLKPTAFGGGNGAFTDLTLAKLGYETNTAGAYSNLNGDYTLTINSGAVRITGFNTTLGTGVAMVVCGTTPSNIATQVSTGLTAAPTTFPTCT
ncbi:MAG: hypothetical protein AAFN13_02230 [Bacteroidota bacterium]